ncbi:MAG: hypothetical protein OXC65_11435 [Thiotrichales bacterium]|nr:hypothetical protein [Thiotrichales bacterium]
MKLGVLPLGRSTFDMPFAEARLTAMLAALEAMGGALCGPRHLLLEADAAAAAMDEVLAAAPELMLVLQVTFTDAGFVARLAGATDLPIAIWAPPEPRLGGRLRLNALCGLNLASHALGRIGRRFSYLYADPEGAGEALGELLAGGRQVAPRNGAASGAAPLREPLAPMRIARIGVHPEGFDTCRSDPGDLIRRTGADVDDLELATLFDTARTLPETDLAPIRSRTEAQLPNLGDLDAGEVDRSLRLAGALQTLRASGAYDGFAIRCWPETFTQYGGAVCGPVSMMGEARVPCACEADVHGAATLVLLQRLSGEAVFLVDLVDLDAADDTAVVWHCGQAPVSMADPEAEMRATVHTNRKQALLYEFPLKPGRVTFFRLSQALDSPKVVVAGGEMLRRAPAFTGTSGVVRFDHPAPMILKDLMDTGMEHHMALAYGDHRATLASLAAALDLPLVELGHA